MADDGNAGALVPAVAALDLDNTTSAAAAAAATTSSRDFFPINDLPPELLVTIVALAAEKMEKDKRHWEWPVGPTWIRHSFPSVCKRWNAIFATKDASPLHETLVVHFEREAELVMAAARASSSSTATTAEEGRGPRRGDPVVHASRVIAWAQQRAESVRKLRLEVRVNSDPDDFTSNDLAALVAAVGPRLEEISLGSGSRWMSRPFWASLRHSVIPAGKLRSLSVWGHASEAISESDVEPLAQLSGSLEELVISGSGSIAPDSTQPGLPRFPEFVLALTELTRLALNRQVRIASIPAGISNLKKRERKREREKEKERERRTRARKGASTNFHIRFIFFLLRFRALLSPLFPSPYDPTRHHDDGILLPDLDERAGRVVPGSAAREAPLFQHRFFFFF